MHVFFGEYCWHCVVSSSSSLGDMCGWLVPASASSQACGMQFRRIWLPEVLAWLRRCKRYPRMALEEHRKRSYPASLPGMVQDELSASAQIGKNQVPASCGGIKQIRLLAWLRKNRNQIKSSCSSKAWPAGACFIGASQVQPEGNQSRPREHRRWASSSYYQHVLLSRFLLTLGFQRLCYILNEDINRYTRHPPIDPSTPCCSPRSHQVCHCSPCLGASSYRTTTKDLHYKHVYWWATYDLFLLTFTYSALYEQLSEGLRGVIEKRQCRLCSETQGDLNLIRLCLLKS